MNNSVSTAVEQVGGDLAKTPGKLDRTTFKTARLLDFCSEKELTAQIGHERNDWPLVVLKEAVDNALDACEESGIAPEIMIAVDSNGITVTDNGPGIPADTIKGVLDYSVRVSNREAYVAPDRGAQGNAMKTLVAMPFVLDGKLGQMEVTACGVRHRIDFSADPIRQTPVISHESTPVENVRNGASITTRWPDSACSLLEESKDQFLQLAAAYACLNPHLTLEVEWFDAAAYRSKATCPDWKKWRPNEPTSAHWYELEHFERLIAAYIAHDQDRGAERSVRELVKEFRGLTGSAKQKKVLDATGLARTNLSALANADGLQHDTVEKLLAAMKENSKPVKPAALGAIGRDHIMSHFAASGCEMDSFEYKKVMETDEDGLPVLVETAFGWKGDDSADERCILTGVNWSPGIVNPFRTLGSDYGDGLSSLLTELKAGQREPILFLLHCVCPRVQYTDRGKSAVVMK